MDMEKILTYVENIAENLERTLGFGKGKEASGACYKEEKGCFGRIKGAGRKRQSGSNQRARGT